MMAKISEPLARKITVGDKQLEFEEDVAVVIEFEDRSIILLESDDIDEKTQWPAVMFYVSAGMVKCCGGLKMRR